MISHHRYWSAFKLRGTKPRRSAVNNMIDGLQSRLVDPVKPGKRVLLPSGAVAHPTKGKRKDPRCTA